MSMLPPPLPAKPKRWKTILLALVVFISGLFIGGAGATIVIVRQIRIAMHNPDQMPARLTARLTNRLNLSLDQSAAVHHLLVQRVVNLQKLRSEFQPQLTQQLSGFHADVRALLDPRQQEKWDTMYNDLVNNWLPAPLPAPATGPAP